MTDIHAEIGRAKIGAPAHRRDVASLPVDDLPPTTIALVWRLERDGDDVQALVAITRGRSARSSR